MASIVQSGPFDSQRFGLTGECFSVTLTHNTQFTIPLGPVSPANKIPYACLIAQDASAGLQTIVGFAWAIDGNNTPLVTVQLQSGSGTLACLVYVLYTVGP